MKHNSEISSRAMHFRINDERYGFINEFIDEFSLKYSVKPKHLIDWKPILIDKKKN
jgi:hypothetical protein